MELEEGAEHRIRDGEMLPMLAVGWQASALRCEEAGHFCKVADVFIIAVDSIMSIPASILLS